MQTFNYPATASNFNNFTDPISAIATGIGSIFNFGSKAVGLADKEGLQGDVKAACGTKPFLPGSKLDAYKTCAANYTKAVLANQAAQTQAQAQLAAAQLAAANKMSTGVIVAIVGVSALVLGVTVFLIIKK
jgi:hypothetical protein